MEETRGDAGLIARIWRGATRAEDGDAYVEYLAQTGVQEYGATQGNRGVLVLRRDVGDRAEFTLVSLWESLEAVSGFAGDQVDRAVFYPEDDRFLVDRELTVEHHEVAAAKGLTRE